MIRECCICGDRHDHILHKWFTPTREDRVRTRKTLRSHGYCDKCHILTLQDEGFTNEEIKEFLLSELKMVDKKGKNERGAKKHT